MKYQVWLIMLIVIIACIIMGFVDAIFQPGYIFKASIKILLFLIIPLSYAFFNKNFNIKNLFSFERKIIKVSFLLGLGVYFLIITAYFCFVNVFDFSTIVSNLNKSMGINKDNFVWIAIYISFINSFLEEFFFRGFVFFTLKDMSSRRFAYIFSSSAFSIYHVAIINGWSDSWFIILSILSLFVGGIIFNLCNEKSKNIYMSWIIHMFANFGINTVGFILFEVI